MVAAEFWEQGDLERTVLDQEPIVRLISLYHAAMSSSIALHQCSQCVLLLRP